MTGGFKGGSWNAKQRGRALRMPEGEPTGKDLGPALSIQCFESRHEDCGGKCPLFGHNCECNCHGAKP